jgi:hypothetical protein
MNKRRRWKAKARRRYAPAVFGSYHAGRHVVIHIDGAQYQFRASGIVDNADLLGLSGLKPLPPFTLNINWGPPTLPCGVCSAPVAMPADGQPLPQLEHNGTSSPLCDPCAVALMSVTD